MSKTPVDMPKKKNPDNMEITVFVEWLDRPEYEVTGIYSYQPQTRTDPEIEEFDVISIYPEPSDDMDTDEFYDMCLLAASNQQEALREALREVRREALNGRR